MNERYSCDIVIPTYNGSRHLPRLLASIAGQEDVRYDCHVIDDFSGDGTAEIVRRQFPWVHLIRQPRNFGPAHNRNVAVQAGSHPYVVIFDDDTYLEDRLWLRNALQYMEQNQDVGQVAAMIVSGFDRDKLLDCGIRKNFYLFGGLFHNEHINEVGGRHLKPGRALGACSAGTVLRREAIERVGGFDAGYFYPVEDLDLSLRVHLAGYDVRYVPSLVVYHYESQAMGKSLARKMYMYRRNCLLALAENFPLPHVFNMLLLVIGKEIGAASLRYLAGRCVGRATGSFPSSVRDYLKSVAFVFAGIPKIMRKRREVNRFRARRRRYLLQVNNELAKNMDG